ncbi:zinc finger protein 16-like [Ooceraea biroi]|uniref:zinc finger protein 16-like n=1 Tax=Ooceraea biroi TaxID=2015173 RepID=UPI000F073D31|nr:zinc finger protein 16-like [Ooceraea biroi]
MRGCVNNYDPTYPVHKRHICPFCKKVYVLKTLLKKHMQFGCKMNSRSAQFACTFCPYKSMYKANTERHVRNVHNTGGLKFRCELSSLRYGSHMCKTPYGYDINNVRRQQQNNDGSHDKAYVCTNCSRAYTLKKSLWKHQKYECVNPKLRFSCEMCSYKTPYKWSIDQHTKKHYSSYRKMYMGDQVLGYTCTMCSKFYKMWSNYLKHKCEPPQFKCPLCPFAAFKAFILHAHQAEQHFKVTSPNT